jgi:Zn-dependent protease/predicted transcriptional regulator
MRMFGKAFQVAKIRGIGILIHPSWLIIIAFLIYALSDGFFPDQYDGWSTAAYWVVGTISALLLFVTVLVHELAHAFVAKRRGLDVPHITLFIFGGVSELTQQPRTAGEEFQIAAAGPLTSIIIAAICAVCWVLLPGEKVEATFLYLSGVNLLLGIFNIIPGFPLDGGRVFRSIAWKRTKNFRRATRIASGAGEMVAWFIIIAGFLLLLIGFIFNGLWLLLIGWFLLSAARSELQNMQFETVLSTLHARDLMHSEFSTVTPGLDLQSVVDDYMIPHGDRAVVVANAGAVAGILTVSDLRRVPREQWVHTPAQRLMTPREQVITVDAGSSALEVLTIVSQKRLNQVPVLEEGRMIGLITRRELLDRVQLAESLAPDPQDAPESGESPA